MITLNIKEMQCSHCVERIGKLLQDMHIANTISLEQKQISVEIQEDKLPELIEELDDIGFTATRV